MRTTRSNPDTVAAPIGSYSQSVRVETAEQTHSEHAHHTQTS